jgi:hypothetical protein
MKRSLLFCANLAIAASAAFAAERVVSPDGLVAIEFSLQHDGAPAYRIDYRGRPLVITSRSPLRSRW